MRFSSLLAIVLLPLTGLLAGTVLGADAPTPPPAQPAAAPVPAPAPAVRYVLTIDIRQSHLTLNIWEHIKDSSNAIQLEIPVDKQFYDDVSVGDTLKDDFRTASLLLHGSLGSWDVTVSDKRVVQGQ